MSFGLYLHYPFCRNLCSYCDFYKTGYAVPAEGQFWKAVIRETTLAAQLTATGSLITSIFIGGGTPSLANLDSLAEWIDTVRRCFQLADDVEFSCETNVESVDRDVLIKLKELNVNRPIFGIQSFDTGLLKKLDRKHSPHDTHRAIYLANALGFENFGVDFLFGLPGQSTRMMSSDVDHLLGLRPPHISLYQLTADGNTKLRRQIEDSAVRLPDQDLAAAMYRGAATQIMEAGYRRYEVSSFSLPDSECRHNLGYWTQQEYLELGPSAHSFVNQERFANVANLDEYVAAIDCDDLPRITDDSGSTERMTEAIMLGLRTSAGISKSRFEDQFGQPVEIVLDKDELSNLLQSGHLMQEENRLCLSDDGMLLVDEITVRLLK